MKRDADLIRSIALAVEELKGGTYLSELENVDPWLYAGHIQMMIEANLIEGKTLQLLGGEPPSAVALRLTWKGHDFLDAARSDTLWKKAKDSIISKGVPWTLDVLVEWLKAEVKNGFPTIGGS